MLQDKAVFAAAPEHERLVLCRRKTLNSALMNSYVVHSCQLIYVVHVNIVIGRTACYQRVASEWQKNYTENVASMFRVQRSQKAFFKGIPQFDF